MIEKCLVGQSEQITITYCDTRYSSCYWALFTPWNQRFGQSSFKGPLKSSEIQFLLLVNSKTLERETVTQFLRILDHPLVEQMSTSGKQVEIDANN